MTRNILLSIRFIRVVVAGVDRYRLIGQRPTNADRLPDPLADPYLLGSQFRCGAAEVAFILGAPLLGWAGSHYFNPPGIVGSRLDRGCGNLAGHVAVIRRKEVRKVYWAY